jgi:hypothetical protein
MALKSKKAQAVEQQADPFCRIWYICKGTLVYRRYGWSTSSNLHFVFLGLHSRIPARLTCFPPWLCLLYSRKGVAISNEAMRQDRRNSGYQQFSVDRSTSLSDTWFVQNTWLHEPNLGQQTGRTSPCRLYDNEKVSTVHDGEFIGKYTNRRSLTSCYFIW